MGSFFVTSDAAAVAPALARFAAKGLTRYTRWAVGPVHALVFDKRAAPPASPGFAAAGDGDAILGVGSCTYDGACGAEALRRILAACRRGESPFAEVNGHWLLLLRLGGRLSLVTDKTGVYHAYEGRSGPHFYLSNSLLAVAESFDRLTVGAQECLEFLFTQCTYGQRTIFEEIRHLDPGTVYAGADLRSRTVYYRPRDEARDLAGYLAACDAYLAPYREAGGWRVNCDLSGGYDTRTVAALLAHAGVPTSYNTNVNADDPDDHRIAMELAAAAGGEITLFRPPVAAESPEAMASRTLAEFELCRDIYRSSLTPHYFDAKARSFDLIFGGYGGELLRDKYSRFRSVREMVRAAYITPGIRDFGAAGTRYVERLVEKFEARLADLGERDIRKGVEKIYYLEKMKYWGGSRITAFNQYCHHVHPLLDDALARYAFAFPLEAKRGGALQRRMITLASEILARVRSSYDDRPMLSPSPPRIRRLPRELAARFRRSWRGAATILANLRVPRTPSRAAGPPRAPRVEACTGVALGRVYNAKTAGRILTLERVLAGLGERIR